MIYPLICPVYGEIELTKAQYIKQMMNPDAFWYCPTCMSGAEWDDERYENSLPKEEDEE